MLDVLTWPVGRAPQPSSRAAPLRHVALYTGASASAGAAMGAALGSLGMAVQLLTGTEPLVWFAVLSPIAVLAAYCQAIGRVHPLPERQRQVPKRWLLWHSRGATAAAFGAVIGVGALTYLRHAVAWVLALVLLAGGDVATGALVGITYGVTRAGPLVLTSILDRHARPRPRWGRLTRPSSHHSRALAVVAVGVYALSALSTSTGS